ncbi:MAG: hypothetical protein J7K82_00900 [Thermoproteales archaeon]|nr:hypothetical protein [Thermoproteales archaeon]
MSPRPLQFKVKATATPKIISVIPKITRYIGFFHNTLRVNSTGLGSFHIDAFTTWGESVGKS